MFFDKNNNEKVHEKNITSTINITKLYSIKYISENFCNCNKTMQSLKPNNSLIIMKKINNPNHKHNKMATRIINKWYVNMKVSNHSILYNKDEFFYQGNYTSFESLDPDLQKYL